MLRSNDGRYDMLLVVLVKTGSMMSGGCFVDEVGGDDVGSTGGVGGVVDLLKGVPNVLATA